MKCDNEVISKLEDSPMDSWPVSGDIHTHSFSQPEFPERIKLESPDIRPNLSHPVQVTKFSPKRLE